jgi:hypothetical protein
MFYEIIVGQFSKSLNNLDKILDKAQSFAEAKKIEVDVLLNSRLAPDQFNLIRQVQIACDTAKMAAARLSGKEAPAHEDNEKTLSELKERIAKVTSYLATYSKKDFDGAQERHISQPRWEGKYLTGFEFFTQHAIPNLYFHVTTAYSILRHNGVPVGKKDYLGEMPYKK